MSHQHHNSVTQSHHHITTHHTTTPSCHHSISPSLHHCTHHHHLAITPSTIMPSNHDHRIAAVAANCHELVGLDISRCNELTNNAIVQLAESLHSSLQSLAMEKVNVHDSGIEAIANRCSQNLGILKIGNKKQI